MNSNRQDEKNGRSGRGLWKVLEVTGGMGFGPGSKTKILCI